MSGQVIVCGMGQVGHRVVNILTHAGESVVVLTGTGGSREDWLRDARAAGVRIVTGDARDEELLREAGIHDAKALIAITDLDAINMEIALDSKRLRPDLPVVIRVFDQELAPQIEAAFGVRRAIGMSTLAAPTLAAAVENAQISSCFEIEGILYGIGQLDIEDDSPFNGFSVDGLAQEWELVSIPSPEETSFERLARVDRRLVPGDRIMVLGAMEAWRRAQRSTRNHEVPPWFTTWAAWLAREVGSLNPIRLVADIWRNAPGAFRKALAVLSLLILLSLFVFQEGMHLSYLDALYFVITTVTTTGYGDITPNHAPDHLKLSAIALMLFGSTTLAVLFSMVTDFVVTTRFRQLSGQNLLSQHDHFIVVGLGSLGHHVMRELVESGARTVAIEISSIGEFLNPSRNLGSVIIGDARLAETLERAGIRRARGVVAVARDDATNLAVGLAAKQLNPSARTIVQVFDSHLAQKAQNAGLVDATLSAAYLAAPTLVAAALYPNVRHAFVGHGGLYALIEEEVGAEGDGLTPLEFAAKDGLQPLLVHVPGEPGFGPLSPERRLLTGEWILGWRWKALTTGSAGGLSRSADQSPLF